MLDSLFNILNTNDSLICQAKQECSNTISMLLNEIGMYSPNISLAIDETERTLYNTVIDKIMQKFH
jgi:hypothetical protein